MFGISAFAVFHFQMILSAVSPIYPSTVFAAFASASLPRFEPRLLPASGCEEPMRSSSKRSYLSSAADSFRYFPALSALGPFWQFSALSALGSFWHFSRTFHARIFLAVSGIFRCRLPSATSGFHHRILSAISGFHRRFLSAISGREPTLIADN